MVLKCLLFVCFVCAFPLPSKQDVNPSDVKQVHLIFMNHLDVGFDGIKPQVGFINNILNKYFHEYYPRAVTLANQLRALGYAERFIYTTHAWLVSMYLDCPSNLVLSGVKLMCPNATDVAAFKKAVQLGDITWHAGPMNMQNEMFDVPMVDFSLQIAADLDAYFQIKRSTRVLSQRDVPGMSQMLLPIFDRHGIQAITVGVNGATAPPAVPKIFNWKYKNTSLIAMWHPGGYPNHPGIFPQMPGGLSAKDCVSFDGFDQALCFAFRSDNAGPPDSLAEILLYYDIARGQFPNAVVQASTFEDFAILAGSIKDKLPVVDKEIGDVWIQGVSSDPLKVAKMRAFYRARTYCIKTGMCNLKDRKFYNASRFLVKLAEHTWGIDSVFDTVNWTNIQFYHRLKNNASTYSNAINSWISQRAFLDVAMEALGDHPLVSMVTKEWKQIQSTPPDITDMEEVPSEVDILTCDKGYSVGFNEQGQVTTLIDPYTKTNWASETEPLGQFLYQTYNQTDFDELDAATTPYSKHFFLGIGKPNLTKNTQSESKFWRTRLVQRYRNNKNSECDFMIHIQIAESRAVSYYGAPPDIWIRYTKPQGEFGMAIEVQWYNKQPTRLPESIFFSFQSKTRPGYQWQLHKLDQILDPLNVVINGSQRLHAIDEGVMYSKQSSGLLIESPDVAMVTVLTSENGASGLPLPLTCIKDVKGMAFNLYNNLWNVNYIFWYPYLAQDKNQKFRFMLNFPRSEKDKNTF
ncbi:hypothetical protein SNE40_006698 [Patella caerulea]|uniref:Glycoside hydrolase family 38 N-terminal domain-containing protein n=1 Tax=Patella caerulea TaxID=87958 RepID=A0AAN8K368_PATCE